MNKYLKVLLFLFILYFIIKNLNIIIENYENHSYDNIDTNIGNYFAEYFYSLGFSIIKKEDWIRNPGEYPVLKFLPHKILYNNDENYSNLIKEVSDNFVQNNITFDYIKNIPDKCGMWFIHDNYSFLFWMSMKTLIKKLLDDMFTKANLNTPSEYPIIHFRCADTPFVKHSQYHLVKYEYYKKALENIKLKTGKNYNKVTLLSCHIHKAPQNNQENCQVYTDSLKSYLNSIGYEVEKQCNSNINDFAKLFYAPAVISNVSSFSFISGFFGKGIFISSEFNEENNTEKACNICDGWIIKNYQLKHKFVNDYYDNVDVVNKLKN